MTKPEKFTWILYIIRAKKFKDKLSRTLVLSAFFLNHKLGTINLNG